MNRFIVNRKGYQNGSPNFDQVLTRSDFDDIYRRIGASGPYEVQWVEERNEGRLVIFETARDRYYITLSPKGKVNGRNSFVQSVPTAYTRYIRDKSARNKHFCFYYLPTQGNNNTNYLKYIYRLASTIGIIFLNPIDQQPIPFSNVHEIIEARNRLQASNKANNSSYVTDEGSFYHVYGKTFGANSKESTLTCLAIAKVTDKNVRLFNIMENGADSLSEKDINALKQYVKLLHRYSFEILDDTYVMEDVREGLTSQQIKENLRDPRFTYNLLQKTHGEKECALCGCKVECIVQGAHIYPIKAIKRRDDWSMDRKIEYATDKDNGMWLCENHHKLFDRDVLDFENGEVQVDSSLNEENKMFVENITTRRALDRDLYNSRMEQFFQMRRGVLNQLSE